MGLRAEVAGRAFLVGGFVLFGSCTEPDSTTPVRDDPVISEEDGTRTVLNHSPAWDQGAGWTVSTDPILRIGMLAGAHEYLLDRVEGVTRLSDGTIVVLNAGDGQLRYYRPDGTYLRSAGRVGDGPGEMRAGRWLDRLDGDVVQVTHTAGRLRYGSDGELIQDDRLDWNRIHEVGRRATLEGSAGFLMEACDIPAPLFLDDSVLLCGSSYTDARFMPDETGVHQSLSMVVRAGWELGAADTVGIFETRSLVMFRHGGMLRPWFLGPVSRPRGWLGVTGSPTRVTFATSESYRIEVYDLESAEKRMVIERTGGLRSPTEAELERLAGPPPESPGLMVHPPGRILAQVGAVDSLSILADAPHIDATGAIWAPLHTPRDATTRPFDVFDPGGIFLGRVTVPDARFDIHEIGLDYILGVERGEFAEQYVVLYELDRGGSG